VQIDIPVKTIQFNLKEYSFNLNRMFEEEENYQATITKSDKTEKYIFDFFQYKLTKQSLTIVNCLPRQVTLNGKTETSQLDPEIWTWINHSPDTSFLFTNLITGAFASLQKSGEIKLLTIGHTKFDYMSETKRYFGIRRNTKYSLRVNKRKKGIHIFSKPELKARDTLRDLVSEKQWRKYLSRGYVIIKGKSGKVYQIFAKHLTKRIQVYEKNIKIFDLCIHSENVPNTDHVITCMLLIQNNEEDFIKQCNKRKSLNLESRIPNLYGRDPRHLHNSLVEIFKINKRIAKKLKVQENWIDETRIPARFPSIDFMTDQALDAILGDDFFEERII